MATIEKDKKFDLIDELKLIQKEVSKWDKYSLSLLKVGQ